MMSKKLFLLASALPLAVWLQGCKKDKKKEDKDNKPKPGDKNTKPADPSEKDTQHKEADKAHEQYFEFGNKKQLMTQMLKDTQHVKFDNEADGFFLTNPSVMTAYVLPSYTHNHEEAMKGTNYEYKELLGEFSVKYSDAYMQQRSVVQNMDVQPASIGLGLLQAALNDKTQPVMYNGQRSYNGQMHTAETLIVDVVSYQQQSSDQVPKRLLIIAELYHTAYGRSAFPRGNPMNFAVVFMPYVDNAKVFFEICVKTFWHVVFINHVTDMEIDDTQRQLWDKMSVADQGVGEFANIFEHYIWTRSNGQLVPNIVGRCPQGEVVRDSRGSKMVPNHKRRANTTWKAIESMKEFITELNLIMAQYLRRRTVDGTLQPGDFDLSKRDDYFDFLKFTLIANANANLNVDGRDALITKLQRFMVDLRYVFDGAQNFPLPVQAGQNCPAGSIEITAGIDAHGVGIPIHENGQHRFCVTDAIAEPWFAGKEFLPKRGDHWEEFIVSVYRGPNQQSAYPMPRKDYIDSLEDYKISDLRVINPGFVNEVFVEVMMVAFYHAFTTSRGQMAHMNLPSRLILGKNSELSGMGGVAPGIVNQHQQDIMRAIGYKRDRMIDTLTFVSRAQDMRHDNTFTFEAVAKKMTATQTETIEVEVDIKETVRPSYSSKPTKESTVPGMQNNPAQQQRVGGTWQFVPN